ncbi:unnamed protein product [Paramecium pentaurelia]|uniref:Uncharacterized protein n=1 Tax=Paramecium pentaurelia TaxID=43138 RepID=A0A8S1YQ57_9CILI|nr:unnamed protein product [Paramecium pentaurelia]
MQQETRIDDKYLCTRCLAERVDKENMTLLNEATEMIQSMKTQSLKLAKEENILRLTNLIQLQSSNHSKIKSRQNLENYFNQLIKKWNRSKQILNQRNKSQKSKTMMRKFKFYQKIIQEILVIIYLNSKHIRKKT